MLTENLIPALLTSRNYEKEIYQMTDKYKVQPEELDNILKENHLEKFADRELLLWRMLHTFESLVLEYPNHTNGDLAEIFVSDWNEREKVKINKGSVKQYIESISLQLDSRKRAFISLCDQDVQSCLIYLRKDSIPMVEWLIRLGMFVGVRELDILDIAKVILEKYFPHINPKNDMFSGFKRLNFCYNSDSKRTKFDFRRMKNYQKTFKLEDLPFAKGLAKLILDEIIDEEKEPFLHYRKELTNLLEGTMMAGEQESQVPLELNETEFFEELPLENPLLIDSNPSNNLGAANEIDSEIPTEIKTTSIVEDFENLQLKLKQYVESVNVNTQRVEELERENLRLHHQLEEYEKNRKEVSYEKLIAFIKLIGGREGNFALHEMYEESNGNGEINSLQSQGRLLSLFSSIRLMGIEPYLNRYQLGKVVTVKKTKIGQLFTIKNPIHSSGEEVKVRVTGYGWMLDGKVLVQPIVDEVL